MRILINLFLNNSPPVYWKEEGQFSKISLEHSEAIELIRKGMPVVFSYYNSDPNSAPYPFQMIAEQEVTFKQTAIPGVRL